MIRQDNSLHLPINAYRELVDKNRSVQKLLRRVYRRTESIGSVITYLYHINKFSNWVGESPDKILEMYGLEDLVNEYIDDLYMDGYSPNTIALAVSAIKKWAIVNGKQVDWNQIELPSIRPTQKSSIPTKEMLRRMLEFASPRLKAVIMLAVTSGLRIGTIVQLRIRNLPEYDIGTRKFTVDIPLIYIDREITKGKTDDYFTFITPEAKEALEIYLKERDDLTLDSFVIEKERRLESERNARQMVLNLKFEYNSLLRKLGYDEKDVFHRYRFHMLRKFFKTYATFAGIPSEIVEFMMGHRSGIKHVYFMGGGILNNPVLIDQMRNFYRKLIPQLRIKTDERELIRLEKELDKYKDEYNKKVEEIALLENRLKKVEEILNRLLDSIYE